MPLVNLGGQHFTTTEKQQIRTAVEALKNQIMAKMAMLTPEQRKQYGSVNEFNKLLINKVKDYADNQPAMASPDVDWSEFKADHSSRAFLQEIEQALEDLIVNLSNTRILHDWDNYHDSLTDYGYSQYKFASKTAGFEIKVKELKQFFPRSKGEAATPPEEKKD